MRGFETEGRGRNRNDSMRQFKAAWEPVFKAEAKTARTWLEKL